ncbi:MAG: FAD-dependent oxidoreductase [Spirochaetia bacterium]|nr:FAD-dependent oxidoreductase [Spirochaetia bacterium]MCF7941835.1 FAD-dependent oxidoreductase [Spirochaetia bacterium]
MNIIIIGGVAGGASAAARLRRLSEEHRIIMFERGKYISFANCGLPYHIGGTISERDNLLVQTVEGMEERFNIDIRIETEVLSIDPKKHTVQAKDLTTGEVYEEAYDKLLLSPGAEPVRPPIPGIDSPKILTLRNMSDMDRIIEQLQQTSAKKAVVIGAGFIGMEIAENLHDKGIAVAVVEKMDQVLAPVDIEIAAQVHQHFKEFNVGLYLGDGVIKFEDTGSAVLVSLESGAALAADIVILAIGVRPETSLAQAAGLEIGVTRGIKVNEYLQSSDDDIYAVGDAIEVANYITGKETLIPLAWPANRQGRIVADNMLGQNLKKYTGSLGTSILKVFDLTVSATGMNEKALKAAGLAYGTDYLVVTVNRNNHAGYYPGAVPFTLKLIFSPEGKIFGAQGVGYDGVDKRIDVIATAIKAEMTIYDLQELELAYAPPYNSAKDPVNIAGYAAENLINGTVKNFRWYELDDLLAQEHNVLLDIRTADEHELGVIPGSIHIPLDELRTRSSELDTAKTYLVYCQIGQRGYVAARILQNQGFDVRNFDGGYKLWQPLFLPQDNRKDFDQLLDSHSGGEKTVSAPAHAQTLELNACGLQCPGPIIKTKKAMDSLSAGDTLVVKATDPGFKKDIRVWAEKTGNSVISVESAAGQIEAKLQKGAALKSGAPALEKNRQTLVVFSGDLDKAIAAMIIANGALAMGKDVSLFFTFWGLNILRKDNRVRVKKSMIEKMFGAMMPRGVKKLKLSQMHMAGMGTGMIRSIMKKKHVDDLGTLIDTYLENGGKILACTMSMDLMGIKEEELIDGIEYGGVASYLGDAQEAYSNLFI